MAGEATWLHAVFSSSADARDAVRKLAEAKIAAKDVEIRSSVPLGELPPLGSELRTRVPLTALCGGLVGGTAAFMLVSLSSMAYPLPTGGMAIVPMPPAAIVTFEGVAMGAVLSVVATVLIEGGLLRLRGRPGPFDRQLADGGIVVSVRSRAVPPAGWASNAVATEL
ncbi:MAG: DUF3341 domain-containing protein [Gemmatimonadetes bacterium]|nr:DUF3341 domain-containing protein [Gemmatimonadota bacterium]